MARPLPPGFPTLSIAPPALADKLMLALPQWCLGLEEPGLARHLAARALLSGDADLFASGAGLALWSWQRAPLEPGRIVLLLEALAAFSPSSPPPGSLADFLNRLQSSLAGQPEPDEVAGLLATGDTALAVRLLLPRLRDPSQGVAWLASAWDGMLRLGSPDLCAAALSACPWPEALVPLRARLAAELSFHFDAPETALLALDEVDAGAGENLFGAWAAYLRAELLLRLGRAETGRALLAGVFASLPWHTHLGLKLHALSSPPPMARPGAAADAAILLYSWNKADLVRQTLESLAGTDIAGARIWALDNGSTDGTGEAMEAAKALFPPDVLNVVRVPVNIGAPAARNWLLSLPEVRARAWAVFLDDDVLLPQAWLSRLLGAGMADDLSGGRCGAVGCRIVSASLPTGLQSADYQLFPPGRGARTFEDRPDLVNVFDNCSGGLDVGLFSYTRPAVHVSGCCHALRTSVLAELGGFDIAFSPTQFDDLERDLRSAVAGRGAVYCGDVAVAHVQHSSLAKAKGPAAIGQVMGNKLKLEGKFAQAELAAVSGAGLAALWADMAAKWAELAGG
ncbi:MAG: glycosyl transferase family 2 [Deltaproteobacteria bacterium HGW-Deltaproteobacteria-8]|nr:MAG: glycosyl transferase family 2 [Deltaproteobacteria bacterium HGW-Deltaproteobacteria-8]